MRRKAILTGLLFILLFCLPFIADTEKLAVSGDYSSLYESAGQGGLYNLDILGGEESVLSLTCRGSVALVTRVEDWESEALVLTVFDVSAGTVIAKESFSIETEFGFLDDGRIYALNTATMELSFFDEGLKLLARMPGTVAYRYGSPFLSSDGDTLWCLSYDEGALVSFSVPEGTVRRYGAGGKTFQNIDAYYDTPGGLLFFASDSRGRYGMYGAQASGNWAAAYEVPDFLSPMAGGLLYAVEGDSAYFAQMNNPFGLLRVNDWPQNAYPRAGLDSLLMTGSSDTLRLVDLSKRVLVNEVTILSGQKDMYYQSVAISGEGFALISLHDAETGRSSVWLWDYAASPIDSVLDATDTRIALIAEENKQMAEEIRETFGIRVFHGTPGASFEDSYYKGDIEWNELRVHAAMKILRGVLSRYPAGMLEEMCVSPVDHIDVYFCGYISRTSDEGIMTAAALTGTDGDARYIVCNLNNLGEMARNLGHEFMHVMEDRIEAVCAGTGSNMLDYWLGYVPEGPGGPGYYFSYLDKDGNELSDTAYTGDDPLAADMPDTVWFVDAYAKANPKEDRARIMEYLFDSKVELPAAFNSVHLMEKAQYLCAVIRECFPSTQAVEILPWERLIKTVPYSNFEDAVNSLELLPAG